MRRLLLAAAVAVLALPGCTAAAATPAGPATVRAWLSTYDWWNNSPPGYGISYPGLHQWACCRAGGSYANPITFASQDGELAPGTRIYIPSLRRYFIKEDLCSTCYRRARAWQFDLWVGGVGAGQNRDQSPHDIVNLWEQATVVINPPRGEPVDPAPFRSQRT